MSDILTGVRMRYCPKCNGRFDDSNSFCLNDGTTLLDYEDEQATYLSSNRSGQSEKNNSNSQNFLKYPIYAFLGIVALVGLIIAIFWFANRPNATLASMDTQNSADNVKLKEKELELKEKELELKRKELEGQTPEVVQKALPPNSANSASSYSGSINSDSSTFNLSWNKNNTVTGSFYYNYSPNQVYTISGTNFRKGEADIKVFNGSQIIGTMKIYKQIGGNKICWSGSFYQSNGAAAPVSFCRYR